MRILTRGRLFAVSVVTVPTLLGVVVDVGSGYAVGGTNLVANSGFEAGGGSLTGWTAATAKLSLAGDGDGGGHAALVAVNGKSKPPAYGIATSTAPVASAQANETYAANARVRSATPGKSVCLVVREVTPGGTVARTAQQCAAGTSAWSSLPATALTVGTTGDSVTVTVQGVNGVAGDSFETDNVTLVDADSAPPSAPGSLTATATSTSSVSLAWTAATDTGGAGVSAYVVARGGSTLATLAASATGYTDATVSASTPYSYTVTALDYAGNASAAAQASVTTPDPPPDNPPTAPANLQAVAPSTAEVDLSWGASTDTDATGVAGYTVVRNGSTVATLGAGATSYADTAVSASTTYQYSVTAFDSAQQVSAAATASATTPDPPPDGPPSTPGSLTATAPTASEVDLTWTASTDGDGTGVAGYTLTRNGSTIATLGAAATSYADTSVAASTGYTYTLTAFDSAQLTSPAATATVTTPAPPVDNPPSVPTGFTATAPNSGEVDLKWKASTDTDSTGLAGYQVTRNGTVLATVGPTSVGYVDFAVSPSTAYTYSVRAYDTANNFSPATANANVTTPATTVAGVIDDLWHMDETSGTTMVDSGSTPHNGILRNVTLGLPGDPAYPGTSYGFNGSTNSSDWAKTLGSAVDLGAGDDLNAGANDVRIAFSLRTTTVPPSPDYDLFRKGEYPSTEYKIELQPNGQVSCEFRTLQADGSTVKGYTIQPAIDVHDGVWHRITCSKVGGTMTMTVDGAKFTKSITGSISNPYHMVVGAYSPTGSGDAYHGQLDELTFRIG